jgi:hypothetical protein
MVVIIHHLITFELHSWVKWVTPNLLTPKTWGKTHHRSLSVCLSFYSRLLVICVHHLIFPCFLATKFLLKIFFQNLPNKNKWSNLIMIFEAHMLIWWSTHNFHTYPTVLQYFGIFELAFWRSLLWCWNANHASLPTRTHSLGVHF